MNNKEINEVVADSAESFDREEAISKRVREMSESLAYYPLARDKNVPFDIEKEQVLQEKRQKIAEIQIDAGIEPTNDEILRREVMLRVRARQPLHAPIYRGKESLPSEAENIEKSRSILISKLSEWGINTEALNNIERRVFVLRNKDRHDFEGTILTFGNQRFLATSDRILRDPDNKDVIIHEMLHLCQSDNVDSVLMEGIVDYLTLQISTENNLKAHPNDYMLDRRYCELLAKKVGEDALIKALFEGTAIPLNGFSEDDKDLYQRSHLMLREGVISENKTVISKSMLQRVYHSFRAQFYKYRAVKVLSRTHPVNE